MGKVSRRARTSQRPARHSQKSPESASTSSKDACWSADINVVVRRPIPAIPDAARTAEIFGLRDGLIETLYDNFRLTIRTGEIVAVIGPSGAGKSVLLREFARQIEDAVWLRAESLSRCDLPPVAVLKGPESEFAKRLEILSRCGLAEATAMVTPAKFLSGGQKYRLALARALFQAGRRNRSRLVIADEFASCLDHRTAATLCEQVRKLVSNRRLAMLIATPRDDLMDALRPDRVITKPLCEPARIDFAPVPRGADRHNPRRWRIVPGTIRDYHALSRFHYLSGPPAAHKRVYRIRTPAGDVRRGQPAVAGVLVVSPALSACRGRNIATAGRYSGRDRSAALVRLNAEMEWISRVVVHPAYRGCGLAVRLVRHALRKSQTPWMESLAVMGRVHPFFELAGMTCYGQFQGRRLYTYYLARTPKAPYRSFRNRRLR